MEVIPISPRQHQLLTESNLLASGRSKRPSSEAAASKEAKAYSGYPLLRFVQRV